MYIALNNNLATKSNVSHASTANTHGVGNSTYFGHVKLSDNYEVSAGNASNAVGASSFAVCKAYNVLNTNLAQQSPVLIYKNDIGIASGTFNLLQDLRNFKFIDVYFGIATSNVKPTKFSRVVRVSTSTTGIIISIAQCSSAYIQCYSIALSNNFTSLAFTNNRYGDGTKVIDVSNSIFKIEGYKD